MIQFFRCLLSMIEWVESVSKRLKYHDIELNKKFCRSIIFSKVGFLLFLPAVLLKSSLKLKRYSCLTGLAF